MEVCARDREHHRAWALNSVTYGLHTVKGEIPFAIIHLLRTRLKAVRRSRRLTFWILTSISRAVESAIPLVAKGRLNAWLRTTVAPDRGQRWSVKSAELANARHACVKEARRRRRCGARGSGDSGSCLTGGNDGAFVLDLLYDAMLPLQVWGDSLCTELDGGQPPVSCNEAKDLCHICWEHLNKRVISGLSLRHEHVELLQLRALEQHASGELCL